MSDQNTISWTPEMLERFKAEYDRAVENNISQFVFEGNNFVTGYAKYLIEYLTTQFDKR